MQSEQQSEGVDASRRAFLRGAAVAGAAAYVVPAVQVIGMTGAHAQETSGGLVDATTDLTAEQGAQTAQDLESTGDQLDATTDPLLDQDGTLDAPQELLEQQEPVSVQPVVNTLL